MGRLLLSALLLSASQALAQAPVPDVRPMPDAAFLQHALDALSAQRNKALDEVVINKAQLDVAYDNLAKANARIKEIEAKLKGNAPAPDPGDAKP